MTGVFCIKKKYRIKEECGVYYPQVVFPYSIFPHFIYDMGGYYLIDQLSHKFYSSFIGARAVIRRYREQEKKREGSYKKAKYIYIK